MKIPFMIGLAGGPASGEEGLMMMMMMITLMSGKSTVAATLMRALGQNQYSDDGQKEVDSRHMVQHHDAGSRVLQVVTLSQDSFYRELSEQEIARAERGMFNFDHPDAFDWDLMEEVLSVSLAVDTDIATNYQLCSEDPLWPGGAGARVRLQDPQPRGGRGRGDTGGGCGGGNDGGDHCAQAGHEVVVVEGILVFYFTRIRRMFDLKLFVDTDPDTRLARLL